MPARTTPGPKKVPTESKHSSGTKMRLDLAVPTVYTYEEDLSDSLRVSIEASTGIVPTSVTALPVLTVAVATADALSAFDRSNLDSVMKDKGYLFKSQTP